MTIRSQLGFFFFNLKEFNDIIPFISKEEKNMDKSMLQDAFKKINICLYIIIGLLSLTLIIQLTNKDVSNKSDREATEAEYDVSMFNSINATDFMSLLEGKEASLIYFGRETCGYCVQFLPILQKAQTDIGYQMHNLDVTEVDTTSDDFSEMVEIYDDMVDMYNEKNGSDYSELYGYTPAVLIVKDGKIQDLWIGYGDYDQFTEWLAENDIK